MIKEKIKKIILEEKYLKIVDVIFIIIVGFFLALFYYLSLNTNSPKVIQIVKGSNKTVIKSLKKQGVKNISNFDAFLLRFIGYPQSGWIKVKEKQSKLDFLNALTKNKATERAILLIPGETSYVYLKKIAKKFKLNYEKLNEEYQKKSPVQDGYVVPNTYKMPFGVSEKQVIYILMKHSQAWHEEKMKFYDIENEQQWLKFITMASIIQKEAGNRKEMPIVSSVIHNRLKKDMKLQMDGALNYGKYSNKKITAKRIRIDKSHFNTYKIKGLPPSPICSVSSYAVDAALNPAKTNYLYFVKSGPRQHKFSTNYRDHVNFIRQKKKRSQTK